MSQERRAKGLYWDRAWKLVEGCTKVSPGCDNCWSETETAMRAFHPNEKICRRAVDLIEEHPDCDRLLFNGDILLRADNLDLPLRVKKPTVFAVWNDLFHKDVPEKFRNDAYNIMCRCRQHTFLILTKRPRTMWNHLFRNGEQDTHEMIRPHIWHGVTAEDQQTADERIPLLLRVPGPRFVSVEPMLGPVSFSLQRLPLPEPADDWLDGIDAVLLGGESGSGARPMHPEWVRAVRDQCADACVSFYFKQWGEWHPNCLCATKYAHAETKRPEPGLMGVMFRCGKKAGRILDERIHDDLPWDHR